MTADPEDVQKGHSLCCKGSLAEHCPSSSVPVGQCWICLNACPQLHNLVVPIDEVTKKAEAHLPIPPPCFLAVPCLSRLSWSLIFLNSARNDFDGGWPLSLTPIAMQLATLSSRRACRMLEVLSLARRTNPSVDSWFSSPSDLGVCQVGLLCVSGAQIPEIWYLGPWQSEKVPSNWFSDT